MLSSQPLKINFFHYVLKTVQYINHSLFFYSFFIIFSINTTRRKNISDYLSLMVRHISFWNLIMPKGTMKNTFKK